jgi:hypothetical protein
LLEYCYIYAYRITSELIIIGDKTKCAFLFHLTRTNTKDPV